MRNLIRKILREYTEPKVIIRIIGTYHGNINEILLKESLDYSKVNKAKKILNFALDGINPFEACYYDEKIKKDICALFKIALTKHWVERLFRLDDDEYMPDGKFYDEKITNPSLMEGIDLILKNRKRIAQMVIPEIKKGNNNMVLELHNVDTRNIYNMVVAPERTYKNDPIKLVLVTQIKGVPFKRYWDRDPNTHLKVHTDGDRD